MPSWSCQSLGKTQSLTKNPSFADAVDDHGRCHGEHHEEVREGQVDNEKIGGCSQILGGQEDRHDNSIASQWDQSENEHCETQDGVPQRVHWGELVPLFVKRKSAVEKQILSPSIILALSPKFGESAILPVGINEVEHVDWDLVHDGHVAEFAGNSRWYWHGSVVAHAAITIKCVKTQLTSTVCTQTTYLTMKPEWLEWRKLSTVKTATIVEETEIYFKLKQIFSCWKIKASYILSGEKNQLALYAFLLWNKRRRERNRPTELSQFLTVP